MDDDKMLFFENYSGRYFRATVQTVLRAEYMLNKMVSGGFGACLNDYFEMLGLNFTDLGHSLGWDCHSFTAKHSRDWVHLRFEKVEMDDGLECTIIRITAPRGT